MLIFLKKGNTIIISLCGGDKLSQERAIQNAYEITRSLRKKNKNETRKDNSLGCL